MDFIKLWIIRFMLRMRRFINEIKHPGIDAQREEFENVSRTFKLQADVERESAEISGLCGEWIKIHGESTQYHILYLHGGGYTLGSIHTHRELVSRIARACHAKILLVDYRLAPENPFPAAVEDAVASYQYMLDKGIPSNNIVIMGDSAGGGLTLSTLLFLKNRQLPMPAAAVCLSPWVDLAGTGESMKSRSHLDPMINEKMIGIMARHYMGKEDLKNPLASSIYADLTGLPPLLIQVGTNEVLFDDAIRLAERAKECHVKAELDIWQDMTHVWHFFSFLLPQANAAINKIAAFIDKHINS
ncbi:MAG: alpha/beta hydrolase [Candidatus Brocadiae bacterium]|nr:alpha/beta hydrolase [Candidatus Brocadiia bacterium]